MEESGRVREREIRMFICMCSYRSYIPNSTIVISYNIEKNPFFTANRNQHDFVLRIYVLLNDVIVFSVH